MVQQRSLTFRGLIVGIVVSVLAVVILVACGSEVSKSTDSTRSTQGGGKQGVATVPMSRGNAARTGVHPGPALERNPKLVWSVNHCGDEPIVVSGIVYVACGSYMYAFDAATGEQRWAVSFESHPNAPVVHNGTVYIPGANDGQLHARDAKTGEQKWVFQAEKNAIAECVTALDSSVYLTVTIRGTASGGRQRTLLYALAASNAQIRWQSAFPALRLSCPAVAEGILYVGTARDSNVSESSGSVHAVDAKSGAPLWRFETKDTVQSIAVSDGIVIAIAGDYYPGISALDSKTGNLRWQSHPAVGLPGGYTAPAIKNGIVYVVGGGNLYALDMASGSTRWLFKLRGNSPSAPTAAGTMVYTGDRTGYIYAVDGTTGVERWRFEDLRGYIEGISVVNGMMYVTITGGGSESTHALAAGSVSK